jgi:hypothetical protein
MDALAPARQQSAETEPRRNVLAAAPALSAAGYPFLLQAFHLLVGPPGALPSPAAIVGAALVLSLAFAVPALGIALARGATSPPSWRRLAYASVLSPTLYVFLGVVQSMASSPVPDELVWCALWSGAALWAWFAPHDPPVKVVRTDMAGWRIGHGLTAAILLSYVLFHIGNHLAGLIGPEAHAAVMDMGRKIYRASVVEPLLVALMVFQVGSGLHLAWRWSAAAQDSRRTFQVASGAYLSVFVLGHMNSVFLYARTYLEIPTGWAFATGAPTGLIHDAWNIRLLPHYALGVFFVLAHLACGLRVVAMAHGVDRRTADRVWTAGALASATVASAIIAGMCGVRIAAP